MASDLLTTRQAAAKLGLAPRSFLDAAKAAGIEPALATPTVHLWSEAQVRKLSVRPGPGRPRNKERDQ